jgi:hypothetical protein
LLSKPCCATPWFLAEGVGTVAAQWGVKALAPCMQQQGGPSCTQQPEPKLAGLCCDLLLCLWLALLVLPVFAQERKVLQRLSKQCSPRNTFLSPAITCGTSCASRTGPVVRSR